MTGVLARRARFGDRAVHRETVARPDETLLVAVSRSGTTTETEAAREVPADRRQGDVGRHLLPADAYRRGDGLRSFWPKPPGEESVAQTRSFSSMLVLCEALVATFGYADLALLQRLPDAPRPCWSRPKRWPRRRRREDLARAPLPRRRAALRHRLRSYGQA